MKNRNFSTILRVVTMTVLLSLAGGLAFAAKDAETKPVGTYGHTPQELAARKEMVRRQQEQRITPEKRQAAVEALKAERLRVYRAKQAVQQQGAKGNKK